MLSVITNFSFLEAQTLILILFFQIPQGWQFTCFFHKKVSGKKAGAY